MMRLVHSGDWHLTDGDRYQNTLDCLRHMVSDATQEPVTAWLVGGDLAGTVVPHVATPKERNGIASIMMQMADYAPVIVCRGNHDRSDDILIYSFLRGKHPIHVCDKPAVIDLDGLRLYVLPYPAKRLRDEVLEQFQLWKADRESRPEVAIMLSHIMVQGAKLASGELLASNEVVISASELEQLNFAYVALSHIHMYQAIGPTIYYAGSPDRSNFGEEDEKGYLIATVFGDGHVHVERRLTPSRPIKTIRCKWDGESWEFPDDMPANLTGVALRIIAECDEGAIGSMDKEALPHMFKAQNPLSIATEFRIIPRVATRCPEIVQVKTVKEKFLMYLDNRGLKPAKLAEILEKLDSIEAEYDHPQS